MTTRVALAKQHGVTEELLQRLDDYEKAPEFTLKQKAVLRFVDAFYLDHRQIDQTLWDGMREHFSEEEILEIAWYAAFTTAYGKLIHAFQVPREYEV